MTAQFIVRAPTAGETMFERVNDITGFVTGEGDGEAALDTGPFAELLENGERPRHVLASDSIEHTTEGRTTTVEPEGDHDAYLVVTDERILVVLGDQPDVVEIAFDFESISTCNLKNGFLNTKLVIGHDEESIYISPTDGETETVTEYIQTVAEAYRSVEQSISAAREVIDTLESEMHEKSEEQLAITTRKNPRNRARSHLSEARHHVERLQQNNHPLEKNDTDNDGLEEKLKGRIESAAAECDRRYVAIWLDRGESDVERAEEALTAEDFETFCRAYTTAVRAVSTLQNTIENVEDAPEDAAARIDALTERMDELDEKFVSSTRKAFEVATEADGPDTEATRWLDAYRRLAAASDANWDQADRVTPLDLERDLSSVAASAVEALQSHAGELEDTGEDLEAEDDERAREHYERAIDRLEDARDIADERPSIEDNTYAEQIEAIEEKIDRTKWEWGGN